MTNLSISFNNSAYIWQIERIVKNSDNKHWKNSNLPFSWRLIPDPEAEKLRIVLLLIF